MRKIFFCSRVALASWRIDRIHTFKLLFTAEIFYTAAAVSQMHIPGSRVRY